jgi:hypothetical protein
MAHAQAPRRAELTFSGTTSASHLLIRDVMQNVVDLGEAELDCPMPDSVVAEVMPEGFQPAVPEAGPEGAGLPKYERWLVGFCGNKVPVLLTFWTMAQGGTAFGVQYPFQETVSAMDDVATRLQ